MVTAKQWTKTYPNDAKILVLTTRLSKLDQYKASVLSTVQGGGGKKTRTLTKTKMRGTNKSSVEGLANSKFCYIKKSKYKITKYGQYWWLFPVQNMDENLDGIYMNHTYNKHDGWLE